MDELGRTQSLCPVCLRRLPARRLREGQDVFLERTCPEHGLFRPLVWSGEPDMAAWRRPKSPAAQRGDAEIPSRGCPFDCGLCAAHAQHTCTALVEVTARCDLGCPVCFAQSGARAAPDPERDELSARLAALRASAGACNLQLSGGEPTVRDDLPALVGAARRAGFSFVQLNTNGLRLAAEHGYARRLADAGLASVFLQFDGSDRACLALRGRPLLDDKLRAVAACAEAGLGVVLTPTLARGVNTDQLWHIVRTALDLGPAVRGVHFQPMAAFGRHPHRGDAGQGPGPTLPEVLRALVAQSDGAVRLHDFHPPGCEHALCSFSGVFARQGARGLAATRPAPPFPPRNGQNGGNRQGGAASPLGGNAVDAGAAVFGHPPGQQPQVADIPTALEGALAARAFTARQWAAPAQPGEESGPQDDFDRFLASARAEQRFSISCMAFQDAWTVDLERTRGCCIHVATADGGRIPFCLYNLTARNGRALYRGRR